MTGNDIPTTESDHWKLRATLRCVGDAWEAFRLALANGDTEEAARQLGRLDLFDYTVRRIRSERHSRRALAAALLEYQGAAHG